MRHTNPLSAFVAIALATLTFAFPACADDTHDTATSTKTVSVTVRPGWHVNKDYPWKLVVGDTKYDKTHFVLTETTAVVADAPTGKAKLKGAVCSGDKCKAFEEDVVVP